jgi:hypothetical protein
MALYTRFAYRTDRRNIYPCCCYVFTESFLEIIIKDIIYAATV